MKKKSKEELKWEAYDKVISPVWEPAWKRYLKWLVEIDGGKN